MTFRIANNQIHIGLKGTWVIVGLIATGFSAVIGGVWQVRAGYDKFVQEKQETNTRLSRIESKLGIITGRDSVQDMKIDAVASSQSRLVNKFDSLNLASLFQHGNSPRPKSNGTRFYTEKWVNGQLQLTEVKQN